MFTLAQKSPQSGLLTRTLKRFAQKYFPHRTISRHISTQFLCRVMVRKMVYFSGLFVGMP